MATDSTPQPYRETAATHIRTLSTLNARIPSLLTASATTFSQLTNAPITPTTTTPNPPDTPSARHKALHSSATTFFTTVLELGSALHAQIEALEKEKVVPADEVKYSAPAPTQQGGAGQQGQGADQKKEVKDSEATVKNGGLGSYDVGVLNARAGVRQKDGGEVLERVRVLLQELVEEMGGVDEEMVNG
jgi:hypothetical protein